MEFNLPQPRNNLLTDVLQLLVTLGVLGQTEDDRYCALRGIPRPQTILPAQVLPELEAATQQWKNSVGRFKVLRKALLEGQNARDVFKRLLKEYPDILNDPVYVAALRNVQIDTSPVIMEKERPTKKSR